MEVKKNKVYIKLIFLVNINRMKSLTLRWIPKIAYFTFGNFIRWMGYFMNSLLYEKVTLWIGSLQIGYFLKRLIYK